MGKTILTSHQFDVLEQAKKNPEITRWYYLTGGTALAEFYLHHRLSEDLDFFTRSQINDTKIDAFFQAVKRPLHIVTTTKQHIAGLFMYSLTFPDQTVLKADFNEYDFPQLEKGTHYGSLVVDSVFDIAVNKLYTILSRSKMRDFIDLYYCIQHEGYGFDDLLLRVTDKFGVSFEDVAIARQLSYVTDLTDYPTMIVPFDRHTLIDFFLSEVKKRKKNIFL